MNIETISEHRCFSGVQGFYSHTSELCGGDMKFSVYTPPNAEEGSVPVLFFLPGLTCTDRNFPEKAGAQRVASQEGIMLVCPDTSPRGAGYPGEDDDWDFGSGAGFYVDATREPWSARYNMYSYITKELPAFIDDNFPTKGPGHRSIFGHSMGGHGALVMGLRDPDAWVSVSALSPIAAPIECPWGQKALSGYLGDDKSTWENYDASVLVKRKQHPRTILIDQGTADQFLDEQLKPHLFAEACDASGQRLKLRMREGYDHSYYFVARCTADHVRYHGKYL